MCGCGSLGGDPASGPFSGGTVKPVRKAPPLALTGAGGETVDLEQFRGRAVLVSLLFTSCPDTCPLTAAGMRIAWERLGVATRRLKILAVSVDPRGDTPMAIRQFLKRHHMAGRMEWLTGTRRELGRAWEAWGVSTGRSAEDPGVIVHSGQVFGVDAGGRLRTVYPADFAPEDVVADVPVLADAS
jgi:protein SCO1/2